MPKCGTKWPEEMTMRFVERYAQSECLWNSTSPLYRARSSRQAAYQRLAYEFGIAPTEVKFKIKNLRSTYHQELKRNCIKEGTSSLKWYHIMDDIMLLIGRKNHQRPQESTSDPGTFSSEKEDDLNERRSVTDPNANQTVEISTEETDGNKEPPTDVQPKETDETLPLAQAETPETQSVPPTSNDENMTTTEEDPTEQSTEASTEVDQSPARTARQAKRKAEGAAEDCPLMKRIHAKGPQSPSSVENAPASSAEVSGEVSDAGSRHESRPTKTKKDGKKTTKPGIAVKSLPRHQPEFFPANRSCVNSEQSQGESRSFNPYMWNHNSSLVPSGALMNIKKEHQPGWARTPLEFLQQMDQPNPEANGTARSRQMPPQLLPQQHTTNHNNNHNHTSHHSCEEEDEFEVFGRSVALQMQRMSIVTALRTKLKIQTILTEERVRELLDM